MDTELMQHAPCAYTYGISHTFPDHAFNPFLGLQDPLLHVMSKAGREHRDDSETFLFRPPTA